MNITRQKPMKFKVGDKTTFTSSISGGKHEVEIVECFPSDFDGNAYLLKFPDGSVSRFWENEIY